MSATATASPRANLPALAIMAASGFAALGYQIVWTQQAALWLGHESAAVLAVVTAFFGGLALGALALGARIARSADPRRGYIACELVIALWSLVLAALLRPATQALLALIGEQPSPLWHWTIAFGGTFALLLPATAAMGATMPALERLLSRRVGQTPVPIGALYAANTGGAVLGVLASAFVLVPQFGLLRTAAVCAVCNGICALAAWRLLPSTGSLDTKTITTSAAWTAALPLAITGLLGIGYEIVVVRVLSQVSENTVYTFALLLAVYLIGTTLGAALCTRLRLQRAEPLLRILALTILLGGTSLAYAPAIKHALVQAFPSGPLAALFAEAMLATLAFLLPTLVMGALFSVLSSSARERGLGFDLALGINTLGATAAPLLFGFWLIPRLGSRVALLGIVAAYLLLSAPRSRSAALQWTAVAATLIAAFWLPSLAIIDMPAGSKLAWYAEGVGSAVSIVEDDEGVLRLHIDNRQQEGSSATLYADARQALLPMLLHPSPHRALFVGLGTGVTAAVAAEDPAMQVDAVELLPEVVEASRRFAKAMNLDSARRLHLQVADARRFMRTTDARYDLIIADNVHPARSGTGSLYTTEQFAAVRARLADGGVYCQWLPLHQLDLQTLRSIVRSFLSVFPHGAALLATNSLDTPTIGLVARSGEAGFDREAVNARIAGITLPQPPIEFGLGDEFAVLGSFFAGESALATFAGDAPMNTDDRPVVAYRAPWVTYAADSRPRDRLLTLLLQTKIAPDDVLTVARDREAEARIAAYWKARDRYIETGVGAHASPDPRAMLDQVGGQLLAVLAISADFTPAYEPLLRLAQATLDADAPRACSLLRQLQNLVPQSREAGALVEERCSS